MRKFLPCCVVVLLAGCVPVFSLHPLYTRETITFEEKLLGTWVNDAEESTMTWQFARLELSADEHLGGELRDQDQKGYQMSVSDKEGRRGSFLACLVKLQDRLFLDIMPDRYPSGEADSKGAKLAYNADFFLPVHTFLRVTSIGDPLKIRLTNGDEFKKLLKAEPKTVKHEVVDDRPILTASTEELQAFMVKYADDNRLFTDEVPFQRMFHIDSDLRLCWNLS